MTIYAGGHVLLEDAPGVGKTTLALAFLPKCLGLSNKPYSVYNRYTAVRYYRFYDV